MGGWIIDNSKGTANALILGDKEFTGSTAGPEKAESMLQACSTCTVGPLMWFTYSDVASNLGPEVVSYLRTNPSVNYVLVPYDPAVPAVATALQGAGMASRVQIVSNLGDAQNLQYIQAGTIEHADLAWDNQYIGFAALDQGIRKLDHLPASKPNGENVPFRLLTSSNLGQVSKYPNGWVAPYSYSKAFVKLWTRK
jgi:ABC-type sugar transport system substrate-binding protein